MTLFLARWRGWVGARGLPWLLVLSAAIGAQAGPPAVSVNVDEANPPFMYARDGQAAGVYPALLRAAFDHLKVPLALEAMPWKRALGEIDQGRSGVGGLYKTTERLQKYDYSEPLFVEKLVVYFHVKSPVSFTQLGDLDGKRVGVIRGWSYGDDFDRARKAGRFLVEEVGSDDQNFRKLDAMRIDVAIAINESGSTLLERYRNLAAAPTPLSQNPTFLAFAKTSGRTELLGRFDAVVREMRRTGEYQRLVAAELARIP